MIETRNVFKTHSQIVSVRFLIVKFFHFELILGDFKTLPTREPFVCFARPAARQVILFLNLNLKKLV